MNALQKIKKTLGGYKYRFLEVAPYQGKLKRSIAERKRLSSKIKELPPIEVPNNPLSEVHMLCCSRDIDMGIWSSWSFLKNTGGDFDLWVHSDGSIKEEEKELWKSVIPFTKFTDKPDRDNQVKQMLEMDFPELYDWRNRNWASAQLVDFHLFGNSRNFIIMDSDVLTFSKPEELVQAAVSEEINFAWCRDTLDAYSGRREVLEKVLKHPMPERLCAGLMSTMRFAKTEFSLINDTIRKIIESTELDHNHYWSCQTYYAAVAEKRGKYKILSSTYNTTKSRTKKNQPIRHYVGIPKVRYRYVSEGLPKVFAQIVKSNT